jgi:hypothetical protein
MIREPINCQGGLTPTNRLSESSLLIKYIILVDIYRISIISCIRRYCSRRLQKSVIGLPETAPAALKADMDDRREAHDKEGTPKLDAAVVCIGQIRGFRQVKMLSGWLPGGMATPERSLGNAAERISWARLRRTASGSSPDSISMLRSKTQ